MTEAMERKVLVEHRRRVKAEAECRALRLALTRMQEVRSLDSVRGGSARKQGRNVPFYPRYEPVY